MKPIKSQEVFSLKIQIVRGGKKKKCWELGHFEVSRDIRYEKNQMPNQISGFVFQCGRSSGGSNLQG